MHTLTDDELKREPTQLLEHAQQGQVTVVTTAGQVVLMTVPLKNGALGPYALLDLAAALYDGNRISLGRAAEIAGLTYADMMDELGRRGIATMRLRPDDLDRELAATST